MKKTVMIVAAFAVLATPISLIAVENSFYVQGNIGLGMALDSDVEKNLVTGPETAKVSYDTGFVGTLAMGYTFNPMLRAEVEYGWQKNDLDQLSYSNEYANFSQGDLKVQSMMFNTFFNAETGTAWSPFVGAGIGAAKVELSTPGLPKADDDRVFAYQLMAGIGYAVTPQVTVDAQYRFIGTDDATMAEGAEYDFRSNNLMLGARFNF